MKNFLPFDIFIVLFFLSLGIFLSVRFSRSNGGKVIVRANGKQYAYSLDAEGTYKVEGTNGTTEFEIKDGKVRIIDSACPNKNCIRQGWSRTIVCIPNDVIITIGDNEGDLKGDFDAIEDRGGFDAVSR